MKRYCGAVLIIGFLVFLSQPTFAYDNADFQIWNTNPISWKVNDNYIMTYEEELRWADNGSDFSYNHKDIGVVYKGIASWIDVSANYRLVLEEKKSDWKHENRPHINITIKNTLGGFSISNRGRLEFRIIRGSEDKMRFRHKATVKAPLKWTRFEIQPYVADEVFVDFESIERTRNRLYGGLSASITAAFGAEIYYVLEQSKSSGDWNDTNALGIKFKASF